MILRIRNKSKLYGTFFVPKICIILFFPSTFYVRIRYWQLILMGKHLHAAWQLVFEWFISRFHQISAFFLIFEKNLRFMKNSKASLSLIKDVVTVSRKKSTISENLSVSDPLPRALKHDNNFYRAFMILTIH